MKIQLLLPFLLTAFMLQAGDEPGFEKGSMTDKRDGKTYPTVRIGDQWWMAANLDYSIGMEKGEDYRCVESDNELCEKYGRLYTHTALAGGKKLKPGKRGICPKGWHIPTRAEWMGMVRKVNESRVLSVRLLTGGGDTGLELTLSGTMNQNSGKSQDLDRVGYYWTSNFEQNANPAVFYIWSNTDYDTKAYSPGMPALCRCVKN